MRTVSGQHSAQAPANFNWRSCASASPPGMRHAASFPGAMNSSPHSAGGYSSGAEGYRGGVRGGRGRGNSPSWGRGRPSASPRGGRHGGARGHGGGGRRQAHAVAEGREAESDSPSCEFMLIGADDDVAADRSRMATTTSNAAVSPASGATGQAASTCESAGYGPADTRGGASGTSTPTLHTPPPCAPTPANALPPGIPQQPATDERSSLDSGRHHGGANGAHSPLRSSLDGHRALHTGSGADINGCLPPKVCSCALTLATFASRRALGLCFLGTVPVPVLERHSTVV